MKTFKPVEASEVEFTLSIEREDSSPRDAFRYDTEEENNEAVKDIEEQMDSGNPYAWFCAKVTAEWNGHTGVAYLGTCSYKSEEDFKKDGYYEDMKAQALADLNSQLKATFETLLNHTEES